MILSILGYLFVLNLRILLSTLPVVLIRTVKKNTSLLMHYLAKASCQSNSEDMSIYHHACSRRVADFRLTLIKIQVPSQCFRTPMSVTFKINLESTYAGHVGICSGHHNIYFMLSETGTATCRLFFLQVDLYLGRLACWSSSQRP